VRAVLFNTKYMRLILLSDTAADLSLLAFILQERSNPKTFKATTGIWNHRRETIPGGKIGSQSWLAANFEGGNGDMAEFWTKEGVTFSIQETATGNLRIAYYNDSNSPVYRFTLRLVKD
jgi:hypothetical protein